MIDDALTRRVRPRTQDIVKAIERLVTTRQVCTNNQEARLIVQPVVVLAREAHDEGVLGRRVEVSLVGVLRIVEGLRQEAHGAIAER